MTPLWHDWMKSRQSCAGVALLLSCGLLPEVGGVAAPFGLALALAPVLRKHVGSGRAAQRVLAHDAAMIALFGSAAAAALVLWPVVGRDPARFAQLLSDLCHKGPELWGSARAKSPPEILNTLQGCVQPDRISQLPMSAGSLPRSQNGLLTRAFSLLLVITALREELVSFARRFACPCVPHPLRAFAPVWIAHGRSPPTFALSY